MAVTISEDVRSASEASGIAHHNSIYSQAQIRKIRIEEKSGPHAE
jgi:hypothetical protein